MTDATKGKENEQAHKDTNDSNNSIVVTVSPMKFPNLSELPTPSSPRKMLFSSPDGGNAIDKLKSTIERMEQENDQILDAIRKEECTRTTDRDGQVPSVAETQQGAERSADEAITRTSTVDENDDDDEDDNLSQELANLDDLSKEIHEAVSVSSSALKRKNISLPMEIRPTNEHDVDISISNQTNNIRRGSEQLNSMPEKLPVKEENTSTSTTEPSLLLMMSVIWALVAIVVTWLHSSTES